MQPTTVMSWSDGAAILGFVIVAAGCLLSHSTLWRYRREFKERWDMSTKWMALATILCIIVDLLALFSLFMILSLIYLDTRAVIIAPHVQY